MVNGFFRITAHGLRITAYECQFRVLGFTPNSSLLTFHYCRFRTLSLFSAYGLRFTAYVLRLTAYGLQLTNLCVSLTT